MRVVASIRKVIHESGRTSWQARWRDPAGEQRSKNFDRRVDAGRHLTTVEARKLAGTYVDPRAGRLKLGEFAERTTLGWLNRRDSTKARDDSYLNSLVLPSFANTSLGAVHPTDIQEWVARLDADGYSPATIRKAYQLLGRIFSDAVQAGLIVRSPCLTITLPRVESSEMRFLSPDEIGHLADTIDPRFRAMVLTVAYTGCRFGEISALDLNHYQPSRRLIQIDRSLSEVRGHLSFSEPKTPAARRAITIPTWLPEVLAEHISTYPAGSNGLIFAAPEGGPIRRNTFRSRFWLPAVADSVGPPMRFHDLRHSHVALLIQQGTHPSVIAARLGHTSVKTVLDVYGHLSEGLDRDAADTLEPPWSDSDVDAMWTRHQERRNTERGLT
jgi:integrase